MNAFARGGLGRDLLLAVVALAVLLVLPLLFPGKAFTDFVIRFAAFAIFATSLNLLTGYGGMVSFGHGLFYGLGAYSFALLLQKVHTSVPVALVATILICALVALVVGAICIRLKEIYFSFLTLAFQMLLHSFIIAWTDVTGGDQGLTGGIPRPAFVGIRLDDPQHLYVFTCVVLVLSLLIMWHLVRSPFGYTLRMIRDNPQRTAFLGVQVWRVRLLAFVIAGVFPDFAYWAISGEAVFMMLLGGIGVFLGPTVGAAILLLLNDLVTRFTEHYGLVLGVVILAFALGLRKGLLGFLVERWQGMRQQTQQSTRQQTPQQTPQQTRQPAASGSKETRASDSAPTRAGER
jgi:branched-chain amino acid transport system permease protein